MVASRGPVPKRSDMRVRTDSTPDGMEITQEQALESTPLEPDPSWHDIAVEMYTSMAESGQSVFFQQSDWAMLYLLCDQLSQQYSEQYLSMQVSGPGGAQTPLYGKKPMSGTDMANIIKGLGELGATEGARRRLRIELVRHMPEKTEAPGVIAFGDAKKRLRRQRPA